MVFVMPIPSRADLLSLLPLLPLIQAVFGAPRKRKKIAGKAASYRDPNFYLSYEQEGADTERG